MMCASSEEKPMYERLYSLQPREEQAMTEKKHTLNVGQLDIVSHCQVRISDEGLDEVEAQIKAIRAQQAAEKPKVRNGDIQCHRPGLPWICVRDQTLTEHMREVHSDGSSRIAPLNADAHDLGNIFDIVKQGEIVVGFKVVEAKAMTEALNWHYAPRFIAALARYERNKP